jgi:hypothetical protein
MRRPPFIRSVVRDDRWAELLGFMYRRSTIYYVVRFPDAVVESWPVSPGEDVLISSTFRA